MKTKKTSKTKKTAKKAAAKKRIDTIDFANLQFGKIHTDHMVVVRYAAGKWGKTQLVPYGPLELMPSISALHYGQAVFEGMKVFSAEAIPSANGKAAAGKGKRRTLVYRPLAHVARFNRSLERLAMPQVSKELFVGAVEKLVAKDAEWAHRAGQLYLRPFMFSVDTALGVKVADEYLFMVFACPVGPYYSKPLNLKIETEYSRSAPGGVGFSKAAGNYAASMLPTKLAQQAGFDQLIWTDAATHSYVEESGTMNILFVIDGKLVTPNLSNTILAGITRDSIIAIAKEWNIPVEERKVAVAELVEGLAKGTVTEVFGAGTAATIIAVESITHDGKKYPLPKADEKSLSAKIYAELEAIKRGKKADARGWMHQVN
ncbi:MAG: branched-chain amino acid aminotransferase, group [Candidatus Taylorbacteria bacterium]|nr:branched-chain amino acid aminotransferase, group [Candidatus Taylorbacteria bacterium]